MADIAPKTVRTPFSNGEISWKVFGKGIKIILAFHGSGQANEAFLPIANVFSDHTIYAMDLPFHGASKIKDKNEPLSPNQVVEIVNKLKIQESIHQFSIIGFSIGSKLIFPLVLNFDSQIQKVTLIAPDGIKDNFWYRLATGSRFMRNIFWKLMHNNDLIDKFISFASSLHLINSKTTTFVKASLSNQERKNKVYDTWCYLRKLKLDQVKVSNTFNKHRIALTFVIGEKDQIIPGKSISGLSAKIERKDIIKLRGGHYDLIRHYSEAVAANRAMS